MNFALAVVVLTLLYLFDGTYLPVAESIVEGYPAQEAGIMQGDRIIKLNNIKINTYEDFNFYMQDFYGKPIELTIKRGKETFTVNTQTKIYEEDGYRRYIFGFVRQEKKGIFEKGDAQRISIGEAVHEGIYSMAFYVKVPLTMLVKEIASRQISINDFSSMVGVVSIVEEIVETPAEAPDINIFWDIVARMARFLGIITTSVGLVNLFPLPALDGGRLIFLFYEAIFKKRVAPSKEAIVHAIGLFALLAFGVAVIVNELFLYYI
jgi:regulator of sigma E protease